MLHIKSKQILTVSFLLLLAAFLVGCSQADGQGIAGSSWETNDDCPTRLGDGIDLKDDGSLTVSNGEPYKNWELNEDETTITLSHDLETRDYQFEKIDEDTIRITEPDVSWQDSCELKRQ